jgi:hypothetical protein
MVIPGDKGGRTGWPRLEEMVKQWLDLRSQIADAIDDLEGGPPTSQDIQSGDIEPPDTAALQEKLDRLRTERKTVVDSINQFVTNHEGSRKTAIDLGFRADLLPSKTGGGTPVLPGDRGDEITGRGDRADGGAGGGGAGGGGGLGGGGNATGGGGGGNDLTDDDEDIIDHLPGKLGKDYHFVKGPNGTVHVVFNMDVPGRQDGNVSFSVPKELFDRYGVDPDKIKSLTAQQMKHLKGFGPINEVQLRRNEHPFNSWMRMMRQKFGMAPSMLRDKEVMQTLFAAHLGQWDQAQIMGALQQTKWYDTKTKRRVDYLFKDSSADIKTSDNANFNQLQDYTRSVFAGIDWTKHGLDEATLKKWAHNITSGKTGWDPTEAESRIAEIARGIEGTALWASEEQASEGALQEAQEWEDIFEQYRSKNIDWLGPQGRSSRDTITDWAKKRAAGTVTDADYDQFLRQQKKSLFGYIPEDVSFKQFVDPYLSALQRVMGDNASIDWENPLLSDLGAKDANGKLTGNPLSLYDFNLIARDPDRNPGAYSQGTQLYEQGMNNLSNVISMMTGVR